MNVGDRVKAPYYGYHSFSGPDVKRAGTVHRLIQYGCLNDHLYVRFDLRGRERVQKTRLVKIADCEPLEPKG